MENNFIDNKRKLELWGLMDVSYKEHVRKARKNDRKAIKMGDERAPGFFWYGLCFIANELECFGKITFEEKKYIKVTINKDLELRRSLEVVYNTAGEVDPEGRWMFKPTDCNRRYEYIRTKMKIFKAIYDEK